MGSRYVEGHEHVLEETPNSSSASNFSLVGDAYHDDGDPFLGEAMSEAAGSQDLEPEMRSQFSQEGPKEILEGLGIESFETSVLEAAAHAGSFSDGLDSIYNGDGLADFHRRFRDDSAQDFQIDVSAYNREVVVDSAWTSLSAKPLQHFWENDFWHNMFADEVHPLDMLSSGFKRPLPIPVEEEDAVLETVSATKPKVLKQASSDFMSCVKDVIPQNWKEERESLQQIAIYRWHSLLMSWHDSVDIVKALQHRTSQKEQFQIIVDIFYNKAPSTLMKRVRSLSRVTNYCLDRGISFPCTENQMYDFLCAERESGAAPSRMKSVLEACVFSRHILGVIEMDAIINSRRCSGTTASDVHRVIKQSTPLTVDQLKLLHQVLSSDEEPWNRAFAGMCLFCIYARSRWNDAQHSQQLLEDRDQEGTLAFLEAHTAVHKTARALQLRHVFLPLVSPAIGVTSDIWAEQWLESRKLLDIEDLKEFPLMPSPSSSGEATVRALSTAEAGSWLRMLLKNPQVADPSLKLTSHSLKSTCLSFLAKRGIGFEDRLALGYHTSSIRMALTYSRDGASRPLAVLCSMLHEIRHGVYKPDVTRSGRLDKEVPLDSSNLFSGELNQGAGAKVGQSVKIDLTEEPESNVLEERPESSDHPESSEIVHDLGHVTTESSSSSEAETVVKPKVYAMPILIPEGTEGWQHSKLRTLHLAWYGYNRALLCGRVVGKFHKKVEATRFPFDTPRCRQCFHSKDLAK